MQKNSRVDFFGCRGQCEYTAIETSARESLMKKMCGNGEHP